jgi:formamidopyrimidine-DNA glycosylase
MPELPEVETMCRGIRAIIGRHIQTIQCPPCRYRPISIKPGIEDIQRFLQGNEVTDVTRLGKRVVIETSDWALILQPKMAGLVVIDNPPGPEHVRLQLDFVGKPKLCLKFWDRRGLGTVELIRRDEIQRRIVDGRLGPDALTIALEDFSRRLTSTQRPIKVALLDQKLLAGVGNLYASEMLHVAKIHPANPCCSLSKLKVARLHAAMRKILLDAIEHEGSTLADGTYRNALNDPGRYQNQHLVYGRKELPCPTCRKAKIQRVVQAQRSTFFCPKCQR